MTYDPERKVYIGELERRGKTVRFGIKEADRSRHIYVIGQTGTGKSTLLEIIAQQDIKNGSGLIFMDPHGQSVDNLLRYVTRERLDDVVYFAPHLQEKPIGLNIMEDIGYDKRHLVVSSLLASFEKIWGAASWSDRMAYILSNTLMALIEYPDTTLLDVGRMYTSKDFRNKVVNNLKDPQVRKYWVEEFENYTERYSQEATPSIQNKIGQFTSNPLIRNIIGQSKSAFDFRKIMDERKVLLVNLSKGQIGENNARMLGVLFTTKIYLASLSRSDMSRSELEAASPCNFFVDEFQSFANSSFSDILSEARKYKLNLVLAHQYLGQLYTDDAGDGNAIRDAVFGNVGSFIAFRVGPVDAEIISKQFAPDITEEDLVSLPRRHMYLTLNIDGAGSPPFSARTFWMGDPEGESYTDEVVQKSMDTYGVDREVVEKIVRENLEADDKANQAAKKAAGSGGGKKKQQSGGYKNDRGQQRSDTNQEKTHMPLKGLVEQARQKPMEMSNIRKERKKEVKMNNNKQQKKVSEKEKDNTDRENKKSLWGKMLSHEDKREKEQNSSKSTESTKQEPQENYSQKRYQRQQNDSAKQQREENKQNTEQDSRQNREQEQNGENQRKNMQKRQSVYSQNNESQQREKNIQQDRVRKVDTAVRQPQGVFGKKNTSQTMPVQAQSHRKQNNVNKGTDKDTDREQDNKSKQQGDNNQLDDQNKPQSNTQEPRKEGGLSNLVRAAQATGLQKNLKVEPKKEKEAPPINYDEGWVSIGDLSRIKQDT